MSRMKRLGLLFLVLFFSHTAWSQGRLDRYALVLEDPPLRMRSLPGKDSSPRLARADLERRIEDSQQALRRALQEREIHVLGATRSLFNAVYVHASKDDVPYLESLPGVARVIRSRPWHRHTNRALTLVNAQNAWTQVGGFDNAGAGVKIAVIDTGIDQTHPAFQDLTLNAPPGYPLPPQSAYVNNKVIVARSYVEGLVLGYDATQSRPDDLSPRDRVGHGTAVAMVAAGARTTGPAATISGVAPKAFLGNYKVFGSPGVNDVTFDDVVISALEDAVADGMDIAILAHGHPADWGPNDYEPTCPKDTPGARCLDFMDAVENASAAGLTVVVSAGNDGDLALYYPAWNSINTPGVAPSAITVGATTNSHTFFSSLRVIGDGVPNGLQEIPVQLGDGPRPPGPLNAPFRDVAASEINGRACAPLGASTLVGAIAIVERGECNEDVKVNNAQRAGAVAVIVVQYDGFDGLVPMEGLIETGIPAAMIGSTDGQALRAFLQANPNYIGIFDPEPVEFQDDPDSVAWFSSRGPGIGEGQIKPEIVAVGTGMYMATQDYDPNSEMWSPNRYIAAQGTSFAAPLVAGAAALVKQLHPAFTPAQLKSAVVNTAAEFLPSDPGVGNEIAGVRAVGAGKLDVAKAVRTNVTVEPATVSFGEIDGAAFPLVQVLRIRNAGLQQANLAFNAPPEDPRIEVDPPGLSLAPGASGQVTVRLLQLPLPGAYEGYITVNGGTVPLYVPYLYLRGDGVPDNLAWVNGYTFVGNVNSYVPGDLLFKVVDQYGIPVRGAPYSFSPAGLIDDDGQATDFLGIGWALAYLDQSPGRYVFSASVTNVPDLEITFEGRARLRPSIQVNGVNNAASFQIGDGLAPGSYVTIWGSSLSEATKPLTAQYSELPPSLAGVSVSFDRPDRGISAPGRITYVSPGQINVLIPWELLGENYAWVKVSIGQHTSSALHALPLNTYSPALFEIPDLGGSGRWIAAATNSNGVVGSNNPATSIVTLYANGLGPVTNTPPSGEIAPLNGTLSETTQTPIVTIGGRQASVLFSGLSPGSVALYQINVQLPPGLAAGLYEITVTIGGVSSKTAQIYIG